MQRLTGGVDAAEVRRHLDAILASDGFSRSERICRFLRYIIERTLEGETECLKESVIGVQVFDREIGYDPKSDAIVRVEARRLRTKLQEYELNSGSESRISITLPKGGYVPEIRMREPATAAPAGVGPARWNRRKILAGGATMIGSAVAGWFLARSQPTQTGFLQSRPFTTWPGYETTPAFSPDGETIAFGAGAIYLQRIDGDRALRLTHAEGAEACPRFSPDGAHVAFVRQESPGRVGIYVISSSGSGERKLAEIHDPTALGRLDWTADGRYIIFHDQDAGKTRFALVSPLTGARQWIPMQDQPQAGDWWPVFSPDGSMLAFLREPVEHINEVYVMPIHIAPDGKIETQAPRRITNDHRDIYGLAWTADGRSLVIASQAGGGRFSLWRVPVWGGARSRLSAAISDDIMPAVSRKGGRLAYVTRYNDVNIWRVAADGQTSAQPWIVSTLLDSNPEYSPDGAWIAFRSNRSGTSEIWVAAANGSNARRITQTDGAGVPRWSPDSRELVYHARQGGSLDIYIAEATGSGTPRQLTRQPSNAWSPSWSRDGKHIYYGSKQSGKWELWRQAVSGEPAEQLTTRGGYNGRESADGKSVYYSKGNSMPGVFRLPGEDMVVPALAPAMWGNWTLSSRGIYYLDWSDSQRDSARIQFYDFQGDTTRSLATISRTPAIGDAGLAVSPDEKWLLYSQVDQAGSDVMLVEGFR